MRKSRRATSLWLIMIGLMLSLIFISGAVAPQVQLGILVAYALAVIAGLGFFSPDELRRRLPQTRRERYKAPSRKQTRIKVSSAAEKAQRRAKAQPDYFEQFQLVDVGVIVNEVRDDGMHLRRGNVTLDDQGIQPYVVLHADPSWANETVTVRFEVVDQSGEPKFLHEKEVYLREGQNSVLSDNRLPLIERAAEHNPGMWELRVSADGTMVGMHTFAVGPSMEERRRMIQNDVARRRARLTDEPAPGAADVDDDSPVSLEDLLRGRQ